MTTTVNDWQGIAATQKYFNSYSYDPNGNITNLVRKDQSGTLMDQFTYGYGTTSNRLLNVADAAGATSNTDDIEPGQVANNYQKKIDKLEERFVNNEINETLYQKFREKYRLNIDQIESEYASCKNQLSNLEKAVDKCMRIVLDLPSMWRNSTYIRKQRIQNLLFPDGINYSRKNDDYRTLKINLLFFVIPYLTRIVVSKKMGI
jgi:ABC-type phosphate transport system auxiliary subunit